MISSISADRSARHLNVAKHEEIVLAATELFMTLGYELTSMEAVARQAGVSKLTVYNHFVDKKDLFRAIIQHRCDTLRMPESLLSEANLPVEEALLKIAGRAASLIFQRDSIRLIRVIQAEALHHPEIVGIYFDVGPQRIRAAFADLLHHFNRHGQLSVPNPVRAADQFFSLLKSETLLQNLMLHALQPDAGELGTHIEATVDLFLAAYRPPTIKPKQP